MALIAVFLLFSGANGLFGQNFSPAQQAYIDSLTTITKGDNDTAIAKALVDLTEIYYLAFPDTIIPLCEQALNLISLKFDQAAPGQQASFLKTKAHALNNIGWAYKTKGDYYRAMDYYEASHEIEKAIGNKKGMAESLNNIALIHQHHGKIKQAIEIIQKSLSIRESIDDKKGITNSLNNIASIYFSQGDMENALKFFKRNLKIQEEIEDARGVATSLSNIGYVLGRQQNYEAAEFFYKRSLQVRKDLGDKSGTASTFGNLGALYQSQDRLEEAYTYIERSLEMFESISSKKGVFGSLKDLASLEYQMNDLSAARNHALKAMEIAQEIGYPNGIGAVAKILSDIYQKEGNGVAALEQYRLYIQMRDSTRNISTEKQALKQQMQYTYEKEQAVKEVEHQKQIELVEEREQKQKIVSLAAGLVCLLLIVFAFIISNRLKITRQQKAHIELQKLEIEESNEIIKTKNQRITESIEYAKKIQDALLPTDQFIKEHLPNSFVVYLPKDIVAGDFYWMKTIGNNLLVAAADCTGHGVPGAMVSVMCDNALNKTVQIDKITEPEKILDNTREIMIERLNADKGNVQDGMDIALCLLDREKNELRFSGAHNDLIHINKAGELNQVKADKQSISYQRKIKPFTSHTVKLEEGDRFYIYSDGYADQFGGQERKKFMLGNFKKLLLEIQGHPMSKQGKIIQDTIQDWQGDMEQIDDILVMGFEV